MQVAGIAAPSGPASRDCLYPLSFPGCKDIMIHASSVIFDCSNRHPNAFCFDRSTDRTAVSGTADTGSIPVRSAKIKKAHFPAFGQVLGSRSDPAELRRKMGLFPFLEIRREMGLSQYIHHESKHEI